MVWCPPGRFNMGSPVSELGRNEDELEREIIFTQGFFIGKYEVTQTEWEEVMKTSPSKFSGANLPVDSVSWNMANEFCQKLNEIESTAGRLPSGWNISCPLKPNGEYACRAGTSSVFPWGDSISEERANYSITGLEETMPKGSYPEMHGVFMTCWGMCPNGVRIGTDLFSNRIIPTQGDQSLAHTGWFGEMLGWMKVIRCEWQKSLQENESDTFCPRLSNQLGSECDFERRKESENRTS